MMKGVVLLLVAFVGAAPVHGQLTGQMTRAGCVSLASGAKPVTAVGMVALHRFPGSPGFRSIAAGDEAERTFILTLPRPACIDDQGELADPAQRFTTVQIYTDDALLNRRLRRSIGHRVTVTGDGMPANTGHHHAPLVLTARSVAIR